MLGLELAIIRVLKSHHVMLLALYAQTALGHI